MGLIERFAQFMRDDRIQTLGQMAELNDSERRRLKLARLWAECNEELGRKPTPMEWGEWVAITFQSNDL